MVKVMTQCYGREIAYRLVTLAENKKLERSGFTPFSKEKHNMFYIYNKSYGFCTKNSVRFKEISRDNWITHSEMKKILGNQEQNHPLTKIFL